MHSKWLRRQFDRAAALDQLERDLAVALIRFDQGSDDGRGGTTLALYSILQLLETIDADRRLGEPLRAVLLALLRAEEGGGQHPLFRSAGKVGRSEPAEDAEYKARAAAAMDLLMKAGETKDEAARRVARAVNEWPIPKARSITSKKIARWRDHISGGDPAKLPASFYRQYIAQERLDAAAARGLKPDALATLLLEAGPLWRPKSHKPPF